MVSAHRGDTVPSVTRLRVEGKTAKLNLKGVLSLPPDDLPTKYDEQVLGLVLSFYSKVCLRVFLGI